MSIDDYEKAKAEKKAAIAAMMKKGDSAAKVVDESAFASMKLGGDAASVEGGGSDLSAGGAGGGGDTAAGGVTGAMHTHVPSVVQALPSRTHSLMPVGFSGCASQWAVQSSTSNWSHAAPVGSAVRPNFWKHDIILQSVAQLRARGAKG